MTREHSEGKEKREIPYVEQVSQLLGVVSDKVPHLIKSIKEVIYSPEAGKGMGQAVGNFYKELIASGLDTELASSLTKDYLSTIRSVSDKLDQRGVVSISPHMMAHKGHLHQKHDKTEQCCPGEDE